MKVANILALVDEIKPNTYDEAVKILWLSELDGILFKETILTHKHDLVDDGEGNMVEPTFIPYTQEDEGDRDVIAPAEFCDLYRHYLFAQIDYSNGETDRFNNSMIMYNNSLKQFKDWYNRTHEPIQKPLKVF